MKTIGLIGGTSWVSTVDYYRIINQEVNRQLGGHNSARLILYSVNFQDAYDLHHRKDFEGQRNLLLNAAMKLKAAGAEGLILCANTTHKYADYIEEKTGLPLIHIADETARVIQEKGISTVGLTGTATTMQESFYADRLMKYGIKTLVPSPEEQAYIHNAIFDELVKDILLDSTRQRLIDIMNELKNKGAEGIILGCTEIPLIVKPEHTPLVLFDTLTIHATAAARFVTEMNN